MIRKTDQNKMKHIRQADTKSSKHTQKIDRNSIVFMKDCGRKARKMAKDALQ